MIHKIKAMHEEGRGSSVRAIAAQLKISRNTVRKYLAMSAEEIAAYQAKKRRTRRLDIHRAYIVHLLESYPRLSAVKVLRKLREAHGELAVSDRNVRRYIWNLCTWSQNQTALPPPSCPFSRPSLRQTPRSRSEALRT